MGTRTTRVLTLISLVALFVLLMVSTAFAATISQTPNFNGANIPPSTSYTINWTSSGLGAGETLTLRFTDMPLGVSDVAVVSGLPQDGSYTVTTPAGVLGSQYCYYLASSGSPGVTYSDAATGAWRFTLGAGGPVGPAAITQTPNFNGQTLPAGSSYTINWTSTGLASGAQLVLHKTDMPLGLDDTVVASSLSQSGSRTVTVPSGPVGTQYCFYLVSPGSPNIYSNAALTPWSFTIGPPTPVVSTSASSAWSLGLLGIFGVAVVGIGTRLRMKGTDS
jgi:hypothetical protein